MRFSRPSGKRLRHTCLKATSAFNPCVLTYHHIHHTFFKMRSKYSISARNAFLPTSLLPVLHSIPCLFLFMPDWREFHTYCFVLFQMNIHLILTFICLCVSNNIAQFTYASLASTFLFLLHTMLFFWNRYELPALHAGLITPQSPRMARLGMDRGRVEGEGNGVVVSPPRIRQPLSLQFPNLQHQQLPPIPRVPSLDDDRSSVTAPTAPLSDLADFTPRSDTQSLLLHSYPGPMRSYVAAASTSLQSIRSMASLQSLTSLAGGRTSPNFIFEGGYNFTDHSGGVGDDSEEDSYTQRIMPSR